MVMMLPESKATNDRSLGAVEKALVVLESFAPTGGTLGVSELARRAGVPKSTTHRLLAVLVEFKLVERRPGGYALGDRLSELANASADTHLTSLRERLLPYLQELHERTNETVQMAVLSGNTVLFLDKICGHRSMSVPSYVGSRAPAYRSVIGRALLAYSRHQSGVGNPVRHLRGVPEPGNNTATGLGTELGRIRDAGFAMGPHEIVDGAICMAAPVLGPKLSAVAAISVTGPASRLEARGARLAVRSVAHQAGRAMRLAMGVRSGA